MEVGVVDVNRLLDESKRGRSLSAKLRAVGERWEQQIATVEERARTAAERLRGLDPAANAEAAFKLRRDGRLAELEVASLSERMRFEVELTREHFRGLLLGELSPMLADLARERGLQLVLTETAGAVAHAAPEIDLTDELCRRLDTYAP